MKTQKIDFQVLVRYRQILIKKLDSTYKSYNYSKCFHPNGNQDTFRKWWAIKDKLRYYFGKDYLKFPTFSVLTRKQ